MSRRHTIYLHTATHTMVVCVCGMLYAMLLCCALCSRFYASPLCGYTERTYARLLANLCSQNDKERTRSARIVVVDDDDVSSNSSSSNVDGCGGRRRRRRPRPSWLLSLYTVVVVSAALLLLHCASFDPGSETLYNMSGVLPRDWQRRRRRVWTSLAAKYHSISISQAPVVIARDCVLYACMPSVIYYTCDILCVYSIVIPLDGAHRLMRMLMVCDGDHDWFARAGLFVLRGLECVCVCGVLLRCVLFNTPRQRQQQQQRQTCSTRHI